MSLDVYLYADQLGYKESGIYVRENGQNREISRAEWDENFPGREPIVAVRKGSGQVFHSNITHNLNQMADEAGVYQCLWRPDEIGVSIAKQLIEPLRTGLTLLRSDPARFEFYSPSNGWGDYGGLVDFVEDYLRACEEWPDARVSVSR